jgi:hypothetical protein
MQDEDWNGEQRLALLFSCHADQKNDSPIVEAVAILFNATTHDAFFVLPPELPPQWSVCFSSSVVAPVPGSDGSCLLAARSLALLTAVPQEP